MKAVHGKEGVSKGEKDIMKYFSVNYFPSIYISSFIFTLKIIKFLSDFAFFRENDFIFF